MKSVLISIKPKWCELIASGKKTVEVRKTKPKLETPFKCYIYETKDKRFEHIGICGYKRDGTPYNFVNHIGKVIGEFVCNRIDYIGWISNPTKLDWKNFYDKESCLTSSQLYDYSNGDCYYEWRISDLVIYDKPRALSEFASPEWFRDCEKQCDDMERMRCPTKDSRKVDKMCGWCRRGGKPLTRPPQSWCYVESEDTE